MKKIRVMIVEDSLVIRTYLEHIINNDVRLTVAASVSSAEDALRKLNSVAPDVISLDIRLPLMNGIDATLRIMAERPTPIVVFAANVDSDQLNISLNALRAGALTVLEKPSGAMGKDYEKIASHICDQLVAMSDVKVVRQRGVRTIGDKAPDPGKSDPFKFMKQPIAQAERFRLLGLVASTGGPNALVNVLSKLPANFPMPILLVQHITPSFLESFATWLEGLCPFKVMIAKGGELPLAGTIYMAPVDHHIEIQAGRVTIHQGPLESMQRPSGTLLFRSMARTLGHRSLAVLLTGMGDDGATGLKEIFDAGGHTIAEDESTCVVYGMPAAAVHLGGVSESLPVDVIGERLSQVVAKQLGESNVG